jgi:hypothetical protein
MSRKRDRGFLVTAALAAVGGLACIAVSLGFPLWAALHGRPIEPTFVFFSLWGIFALAGAAANVHVYLTTGKPPDKPRGGGQRLAQVRQLDARRAVVSSVQVESERKAA